MSRHHAALDGARWAATRKAAFDRDGWRCTACGGAGRLEAHHEPPLEDGGDPYQLEGIRTLCRTCHIDRHRDETPEQREWRIFMDELAGRT